MTVPDTEDHPEWLNRSKYPFDRRYLGLDPGRVHVVDVGDGPPLLFLHGNPTWSFLFRHQLTHFKYDYRCVAIDYLGFGLSDKPTGWSYRPDDHAEVVQTVIETLELRNVTIVGHDWGGPIGLDYATNHPDNVRSVVLLNTFMWPLATWRGRLFSATLGSRFGRFLVRRYNAMAEVVMPLLVADRSSLSPEIHRHYTAPLQTATDREGSWRFARELTRSRSWLADLWDRRDRLDHIPLLLLWGLADPGFGHALDRWTTVVPHAHAVAYRNAGHFVPEEIGARLCEPISAFLNGR